MEGQQAGKINGVFFEISVILSVVYRVMLNCMIRNCLVPVSWSRGKAFVSESGRLKFKYRPRQIANGSPPLRHFFERSCVALSRNVYLII